MYQPLHFLHLVAFSSSFCIFFILLQALTGSFSAIHVVGRDGAILKEVWDESPSAYLGLMVNSFPNLFTVLGPQSPSLLGNNVSTIECTVQWIAQMLQHVKEKGDTCFISEGLFEAHEDSRGVRKIF